MKITKLIIYNIIAFLTALNIFYIYFGGGLIPFSATSEYLNIIYQPLTLITLLFIMTLLINLSHIVTYSKSKKNLLRISLLIITILFIISIITRLREAIAGTFSTFAILNTTLYLILLILNILILKDLYKLVKKLFNENN